MQRIDISKMSSKGQVDYLIDLLQDITDALSSRGSLSIEEQVLVDVALEAVVDYNQAEYR